MKLRFMVLVFVFKCICVSICFYNHNLTVFATRHNQPVNTLYNNLIHVVGNFWVHFIYGCSESCILLSVQDIRRP